MRDLITMTPIIGLAFSVLLAAASLVTTIIQWRRGKRREYKQAHFMKCIDLYGDDKFFDAALDSFGIRRDMDAVGVSREELKYLVRKAILLKMWLKVESPRALLDAFSTRSHGWHVARAIMKQRPKAPDGIIHLIEPFIGVREIHEAIIKAGSQGRCDTTIH